MSEGVGSGETIKHWASDLRLQRLALRDRVRKHRRSIQRCERCDKPHVPKRYCDACQRDINKWINRGDRPSRKESE